ncbi:MAG: hypothetical protein M3133_01725 [Actinomycetota bacterium]|nr:hypothetical protein [Actinomycetota bacterium]
MSGIHAVLGVAVIASNLAAGAWGGIAWLRGTPSAIFWYLLRLAQVVVVVEVVLGLVLLAQGSEPPDGLHFLYGAAPLLVTLVSEAMRAGLTQGELERVEDLEALEHGEQVALARRIVVRETGVMAVGALLIVTLALRAVASGG